MRPAEIAVHLESWLTAAELVKADPEQALETGRAKIRATHDQTVGASRARKDLALQAARALRDREIAEARQTFNAASTVVTQQHQTVQNAAHRLQDRHLEEVAARAGAELAKLLPEIDRVRSEKEDAAKMVASFKRRSDSGAASASKRPRQEAAPATPECGICMDCLPDTAFMTGSKSNIKNCGHMACGPCAEKLTECHVCRAKIVSKSKLFF